MDAELYFFKNYILTLWLTSAADKSLLLVLKKLSIPNYQEISLFLLKNLLVHVTLPKLFSYTFDTFRQIHVHKYMQPKLTHPYIYAYTHMYIKSNTHLYFYRHGHTYTHIH